MPKPHYRLHADGTVSAPWTQACCGQSVYLQKGHPSGLGGRIVYVNRLGRFVPPQFTTMNHK